MLRKLKSDLIKNRFSWYRQKSGGYFFQISISSNKRTVSHLLLITQNWRSFHCIASCKWMQKKRKYWANVSPPCVKFSRCLNQTKNYLKRKEKENYLENFQQSLCDGSSEMQNNLVDNQTIYFFIYIFRSHNQLKKTRKLLENLSAIFI